MLTIVQMEANGEGCHGIQSQSHRTECWLEGWKAVPPELEGKLWESGGYCELVYDGAGELADIIPTEKPTQPEPEPTETEQLRADVDYLAVMTGVEL